MESTKWRLGEILAELSDDFSISYDDKKKTAVIGEYEFTELKNNELLVSYRVYKNEDWFEDFEDTIDATPDDVREVLEHSPDWRMNRQCPQWGQNGETMYIRKEYRVIVQLGTEVINISAYDKGRAISVARDAIVESYGSDLAEVANYVAEEVTA